MSRSTGHGHLHSHIQGLIQHNQKYITDQQAVGGMDGKTAGEGVVYGESIHVGGLQVASFLVNIPTHVKVDGVAAFSRLLTHVPQLHVGQMHWWEVAENLSMFGRERGISFEAQWVTTHYKGKWRRACHVTDADWVIKTIN